MDAKPKAPGNRWRKRPSDDKSEGPKPDLRNQKKPRLDDSKSPAGKFNKSDKNGKSPNDKTKAPKADGTGTTPKKKAPKKRRPKKAKKVDRTRDFPGDLEEYLEQWTDRETEGSAWKFNKILQAWALDHCFNKKKVSNDLFKQLLPYLLSVQGGALDRLANRAAIILSTDKTDIIDDDAEVAPDAAAAAEEEEESETASDEEEDEKKPKKKEIITKSMAHRAKKIQKGLTV